MHAPLSQAKFWGYVVYDIACSGKFGNRNILAMLPLPVAVAHNAMGAIIALDLDYSKSSIFTAQVEEKLTNMKKSGIS